MDLALILEHLEQYQLASAYDVRSVWMWTEEGGLVFEVTLESKRARRFGSDRVRWHRPVESTLSGSPQEYGFDDWESFIAEDGMSEFFDGFEGGGFWVFGRDPDGVVRVGDPWDPDHLSEPDDGVSAQGVRVRRAVEYRRPSILRTLWAVAGGGPCDEVVEWNVLFVSDARGSRLAQRGFADRQAAERAGARLVEHVTGLPGDLRGVDWQDILDSA